MKIWRQELSVSGLFVPPIWHGNQHLKGNCNDFSIFCCVHFLSAIGPLVMVAKYYCLRSSIIGVIGSYKVALFRILPAVGGVD